MIRNNTARRIARTFNQGKGSNLNDFARTGIFLPEKICKYMWEISQEYQPNFFPKTPIQIRTVEDYTDLNKLSEFFKEQGTQYGIDVTYKSHPQYRYTYPVCESLTTKIEPITLPTIQVN